MPQLAIIVAMTKDRVIGSSQSLPWSLPEDLQLFKHLTMDCTVIMGHKTYTSIGHPLAGRYNIVLSRSLEKLPGVQVCNSFVTSLMLAAQQGQPVFVIGGKELYCLALPLASELHISWVNGKLTGDTYFPEFDLEDWVKDEEKHYSGFHYHHYRRKSTA